MQQSAFALLIEPDAETADSIEAVLQSRKVASTRAENGREAWQALAARHPDIILVDLGTPGLEEFYRRLRDEYMGIRPRLIALAESEELGPNVAQLDLDAILRRPTAPEALAAVVSQDSPAISLDAGRLREMLKLSALGPDFQSSVEALAHRLVLVYGVQDCAVLATASERQWVGSFRGPIPGENWPELWDDCDQAVNAGAPLYVGGNGGVETRFAAPIKAPNGAVVGAICLFARGARLFTGEARDALTDLALRLGSEISWRSVHDRVAAERDRLRENAMIDPMLGILSRVALDQALSTEVARYHRSKEPMCVAVLDIQGLRHINDRYGHLTGDAALKHIASVARRQVRAQDVVARYGADEVAILLPATPMPGATKLLNRLSQAVDNEPFVANGVEIKLQIGIGVTEYTGRDDDGAKLLGRAASSATTAKARGGAIAIADMASPSEPTRPGLQLDRFEAGVTLGGMYQIVHEISRGAMGVVYRAEDLGLSRPVAIKMLRPDLVRDTELVQRFRAEASVLASLNHEHLVRVYAFMEEQDDLYFVMELVEGVSLDDIIAEFLEAETFLEPQRVTTIVAQVASALDAMHDAGIMHRDVKPGNVVLDRTRDRAVLVDVGLAKKLGTQTAPAGTPGFIAPESFRGRPETPASDVYGLAATTYALLTGRAPFGRSDDYKEILQRQLDESPALPSVFRSDLRSELDRVLLRGLSVEANERYATAGDFARALEGAIARSDEHFEMPPLESADLAHITAKLDAVKAESGQHESPRTLTLNMDLIPPATNREQEAMSRGVIFRGAARVLGLRTATSWVRSIARENAPLADALSLRTSPLAWIPADLFMDMLDAVAASGRNADTFARQLAGAVVGQTFRRFYPSSPESLSPENALEALDILWRRYHTWGQLTVSHWGERTATVQYEGPTRTPVCAFAEGWLEAVVEMSRGAEPQATHPQCIARGAAACEFHIEWKGVTREPAAA